MKYLTPIYHEISKNNEPIKTVNLFEPNTTPEKNSKSSNQAIGLISRMFACGPGDRGSIPGQSYLRLKNGIWCRLR